MVLCPCKSKQRFCGRNEIEEGIFNDFFCVNFSAKKLNLTFFQILTPLDTKFKSNYEKIQAEQNDRRKKAKNKKVTTSKWTNIAGIEQKRKREEKSARDFCVHVIEIEQKEKEEVARIAEEKWSLIKEELKNQDESAQEDGTQLSD